MKYLKLYTILLAIECSRIVEIQSLPIQEQQPKMILLRNNTETDLPAAASYAEGSAAAAVPLSLLGVEDRIPVDIPEKYQRRTRGLSFGGFGGYGGLGGKFGGLGWGSKGFGGLGGWGLGGLHGLGLGGYKPLFGKYFG